VQTTVEETATSKAMYFWRYILRKALDKYLEKMKEGVPNMRRNDLGNNYFGRFLYEIMQLCLAITLTSLH
jgi:hypothetical protein